jgi:hypothetical protein
VVDVERVVREGLDVLQVGGVARGAGGFEGVEDVVAGVAEDPVPVCERKKSNESVLAFGLGYARLCWGSVEDIPDPRHAGPPVLGLLKS